MAQKQQHFLVKKVPLFPEPRILVYPPGVNQSSVPMAMPQIAVSTLGTELMLRYIPAIDIEDVSFDLFGIGVKHSISQYIPLVPVDIAVQIMYNKFSLEGPDLSIATSNLAFNAHASRSFGLVTLYGGLQYESTTLDLDYTFTVRILRVSRTS